MIKLKEYLTRLLGEAESLLDDDFIRFLISNGWFNTHPQTIDGDVWVDDSFASSHVTSAIRRFIDGRDLSVLQKVDRLEAVLAHDNPKTAQLWAKYITVMEVDVDTRFMDVDYLIGHLAGELPECDDNEVKCLLNDAKDILRRKYAVCLTDFVNWVRETTRTMYRQTYEMSKYGDHADTSGAYDENVYLRMMYSFFNEDYIRENDMYARAANDKKYVDTWVYLSLHFICALRDTDLVRLVHPRLTATPERVLEQIRDGTFSPADARATAEMLVDYQSCLQMMPHKTLGTSGVGAIKLFVPQSLLIHFGTLFACAEAHHQLAALSPNEPWIQEVKSHRAISRAMGDEIGDLFLEFDFRARSAHKTYLQAIDTLANDILSLDSDGNIDSRMAADRPRIKGYVLAALARSHKSGFDDFASTTAVYLKGDPQHQAQFLVFELFERGVLSTIPSMLLSILLGNDKYKQLSEPQKTELSHVLDMTPLEVDTAIAISNEAMTRGRELAREIYSATDRESVMTILHHIGNGDAVGKQSSCLCVLTAMAKECPYADRQGCVGCQYEISTIATLRMMAREAVRLKEESSLSTDTLIKRKNAALFKTVVAPAITEIITCAGIEYGPEAANALQSALEVEINVSRKK